jgi:hypothetical protein
MRTLEVQRTELEAAEALFSHHEWAVRFAADECARELDRAVVRLGEAASAVEQNLRPLIDALRRLAENHARVKEALATLSEAYPQVDGQRYHRVRAL